MTIHLTSEATKLQNNEINIVGFNKVKKIISNFTVTKTCYCNTKTRSEISRKRLIFSFGMIFNPILPGRERNLTNLGLDYLPTFFLVGQNKQFLKTIKDSNKKT